MMKRIILLLLLLLPVVSAVQDEIFRGNVGDGETKEVEGKELTVKVDFDGLTYIRYDGKVFLKTTEEDCNDIESINVCITSIEPGVSAGIVITREVASLKLSKSIDTGSYFPGDWVDVITVMENEGSVEAKDVELNDDVAGLEVSEIDPGCVFLAGKVYWKGEIRPGRTKTCEYKVRAKDGSYKLKTEVTYLKGVKTETLTEDVTIEADSINMDIEYWLDKEELRMGDKTRVNIVVTSPYEERIIVSDFVITFPYGVRLLDSSDIIRNDKLLIDDLTLEPGGTYETYADIRVERAGELDATLKMNFIDDKGRKVEDIHTISIEVLQPMPSFSTDKRAIQSGEKGEIVLRIKNPTAINFKNFNLIVRGSIEGVRVEENIGDLNKAETKTFSFDINPKEEEKTKTEEIKIKYAYETEQKQELEGEETLTLTLKAVEREIEKAAEVINLSEFENKTETIVREVEEVKTGKIVIYILIVLAVIAGGIAYFFIRQRRLKALSSNFNLQQKK